MSKSAVILIDLQVDFLDDARGRMPVDAAGALAVLRAAKPVTVSFRWNNYLETMVWLNGHQIGTQWRLGNSPSVSSDLISNSLAPSNTGDPK